MSTPTKPIAVGILTPSCDITPTRETARDGAYDEFASLTQNDCSEAPSSAPAVSVEHDAAQNDGAEPSPSSPFPYDGGGERAEPAGGYDSFDPFPGIPAPTKPQEPALTAEEDAPTTRALSQYEEEEDLDGVDSILNDAERTLLVPMVRKQVRAERRERFAEAVSAAVRRACLQAVGVGVLCGAVVYYFHDDGLEVQVPARAVHHVEQALVHLKLALDVARQLHLIS